MSRVAHLLGDATRDHRLLEIGPSYDPVVTRADGWQVQSVDHAPRAELEAKYREWGVDTSRLEEVDYIWTGGPLTAVIPEAQHASFDRIMASHVIEHIPDMLGFLKAASRLLAPAGRLALAVPDKRFGFDYFRPATMTSDVLDRHERAPSRHSYKSIYETYFYNANAGGWIFWAGRPPGPIALHHDWPMSRHMLDKIRADPARFVDLHAGCFTPAGFELIMLELAALGHTDLGIATLHRTGEFEFYVVLDRSGPALAAWPQDRLDARRLALLREMLDETHEQVEMLRATDAAQGP